MSNYFIIIIGILSIIAFIKLSSMYVYHRKINFLINIGLLISTLILPDSISAITFALLIVRLIVWLFGPMEDRLDDYYYERYRRAKDSYRRKYEKGDN